MSIWEDYDRNQGLFTSADTLNLQIEGESLSDSMLDYVLYGTAGALTSAAVGMYNSMVALGDTLNAWQGDDYMMDERATILETFGHDAAGFYDRHKTGVDVTGLVAGSLIPGLGAVHALRALQVAGKVPSAVRAATGMRNADLVLDSVAVSAAKDAALRSYGSIYNPQFFRALGVGAKQQAAEALVFEAGMLLTMNQHATLNPEDMGYFTAIKNQFVDGLPFVFIGAGIGTGIEGFRIAGALKKHVRAEELRTNPFAMITDLGYVEAAPAGDKLLMLAEVAAEHRGLKDMIGPEDWFALKQFSVGEQTIKDAIMKEVAKSNDLGQDGLSLLSGLMAKATEGDLHEIATLLSGLTSVKRVDVQTLEQMQEFFGRTRAYRVTSSNEINAEKVIWKILQGSDEIFAPEVAAKIRNAFVRRTGGVDELSPTTFGAARPEDNLKNWTAIDQSILRLSNFRIYGAKDGTGREHLWYLPNLGDVKDLDDIEMLYYGQRRRLQELDLPVPSLEEYRNIVVYHELGHLKNNGPKVNAWVKKTLGKITPGTDTKDPNYLAMRDLVAASFISRPEVWVAQLQEAMPFVKNLLDLYVWHSPEVIEVAKTLYKQIDKVVAELRSGQAGRINFEYAAADFIPVLQKLNTLPLDQEGTRGISYLSQINELLADASGQLTNPATRELAAKRAPELAKRLDAYGGLMPAWNDTKAYYNVRTGEVQTGAVMGINDVSALPKFVKRNGNWQLDVPELGKSFTFDASKFTPKALIQTGKNKVNYLEYDAQWNIMARVESKTILGKEEDSIFIGRHNLPLMERVLKELDDGNEAFAKKLAEGKISIVDMVGGRVEEVVASANSLNTSLHTMKTSYRDTLFATQLYNENELAKILNVPVEFINGQGQDFRLYGVKDFTKPEVVEFNYKPHDMADYEASSKSYAAVMERAEMQKIANEQGAARLLGAKQDQLPDIKPEEVLSVTNADSRATLVSNVRPDFGSFREKAAAVGTWVHNTKVALNQQVNETFLPFRNLFNSAAKQQERMELANAVNLMYRDWYYLAGNADIGYAMVRKSAVGQAKKMDELAELFGDGSPEHLSQLGREQLAALDAIKTSPHTPNVVHLGKDVGEFLSMHVGRNRTIADKKQMLMGLKGKDAVLDGNVLYPPPRDLTKARYFAFVTPKAGMAGSDSRKFMVFGETRAEFDAKMALAQEKHGANYNFVTRKDVELFKKMTDDYSKNLVFDELAFDSALQRMGSTSELMPNLDINVSGTLERMQAWHHRQEEYLLREGIGLKYEDSIRVLRNMDEQIAKPEYSAITRKGREKDTIYKDTINLMMDSPGGGGPTQDMWAAVNDFVGGKGSQLIDNFFGKIGFKGQGVSKTDLDEFNAMLAENGITPPFSDVFEATIASPDTVRSNAFPALVRTMNNLAGTMLLRFDMAHSIIQLISTPILALPVLTEAKQALRGPAAAELSHLTSVLNPATGLREPSAMKLFAEGTKEFWSDSGKEFMRQLKERGIVTDYLRQYQDAMDFSALNGRHSLATVNDKIDKLANFGSKWSGFTFSEEFTRFQVAYAAKRIADIRGLPESEAWQVAASAVDKVHGIYRGNQRPQLFQGAVGQALGLFQTYVFNFMQNAAKYAVNGQKAQLGIMAGLQGSIFGLQSFPGFAQLNQLIGETNRDNLDLYRVVNADDPRAWGAYTMYGLGSHIFGVPIDFYTRGDLATRHALVVPTNPLDFPAVQLVTKALSNAMTTASLLVDPNVPTMQALAHGMAHNGMNRPMQGLANIWRNRITSGKGQVYFADSNYVDYDSANEVNWGSIFARAIGTRPLRESIIMNEYFREMGYKANTRRQVEGLGTELQMLIAEGNPTSDDFATFARRYQRAGGDIQNFNAYMGRQLATARQPIMETFQQDMMRESELKRIYRSMELERSMIPPWDLPQ